MGRTVNSSPPASTRLPRTAMKAVLLLVLLVLIQISYSQDSHEVSSNDAGDNLFRVDREANPKKTKARKKNGKKRQANRRKKSGKRKSKKSKKSQKKNKPKRKNHKFKKNGKKSKGKVVKKNNRKPVKKVLKKSKPKKYNKIPISETRKSEAKPNPRQTDCLASAIEKTRKYIKYINQLRKANRIKQSAEQMDKKKTKAATVFKDAADAISSATSNGTDCEGGDLGDDIKTANTNLQKCNDTAATKCDSGTIEGLDLPKIEECKPILQAFIDAAKLCIYVSSPECSCFDALPTVDEDKCAKFDDVESKAVTAKKKCSKNSEEGSFGYCRAQERLVGPYGNKCKRCSPKMSTKAPGSRQNLFARIQNRALLRHLGRN